MTDFSNAMYWISLNVNFRQEEAITWINVNQDVWYHITILQWVDIKSEKQPPEDGRHCRWTKPDRDFNKNYKNLFYKWNFHNFKELASYI